MERTQTNATRKNGTQKRTKRTQLKNLEHKTLFFKNINSISSFQPSQFNDCLSKNSVRNVQVYFSESEESESDMGGMDQRCERIAVLKNGTNANERNSKNWDAETHETNAT